MISQIVKEVNNTVDAKLGGITGSDIASIFTLVKEIYGFSEVKVQVHPSTKNIIIIVLVKGKAIKVKDKQQMLNKIRDFLNIPEWNIAFADNKHGFQVIDSPE